MAKIFQNLYLKDVLVSVVVAVILYILFLSKWSLFRGSSESSDFIFEKTDNYKKCSTEFKSIDELMTTEVLQAGDLIECKRLMGTYDHWAVYIGNGEAVHLIPNGYTGTEVKRDHLKFIALQSNCRVNNLYSSALQRGLNPRSGEAVAKAALRELKKFQLAESTNHIYHLMNFNCEHFVTLCAFGTAFSDQADIAKDKNYIKTIGHGIAETVYSRYETKE